MGVRDRSTPPTEWCTWWLEVHAINEDIAYGWPPGEMTGVPDDTNPWFWHWCTRQSRWMGQATTNHVVICLAPLTLTPSLLWPCCAMHGFVREGVWVPA